jgi:hypothetical protein
MTLYVDGMFTFSPDTSIAELIKEHTDTESFRENLQVQHGKHSCLFIILCQKLQTRAKKKICGFPVSSYKNLGRVGRF